MIESPLPLIGFSAYSGTGKTTLLTRLIPLLKLQGLRIGVIKHAHHNFDIDHPGKDSYELRHAGAEQMLVISKRRLAIVREFDEPTQEPGLSQALDGIDPQSLDMILVEGFKAEHFPKIELHRPELGKPLLFPDDDDIFAIASNTSAAELGIGTRQRSIKHLRLNQPGDIASFILDYIRHLSAPAVIQQNA